MTRPRLALLNAAYAAESTRRNFRRELDADLVEFDVNDGQLPPTDQFEAGATPTDRFDGVVITGSAASAYWDEGWIDETREWVRMAHDHGLPILGVCFGHQLLASALGGRVEEMSEYEIGYRSVRRTADSPLLSGVDEEFTVFTTHGDRVVSLPEGAEVFAENDYGIHGFRVGHAFGVQFHPEYDTETAAAVTRSKEFLGDERIEAVVAGITEENYAAACEAKRLFENFTEYVGRVRAEAEPAR
ncbi:type 1 glutamine amidotransferase [Halomarina litorea]|uniref:type 1 glutamine amidotransferase n=1 Tax=Halomarina litorea TaxID=2961595 RepID=UPI0020C44939|nr:type 1 glutamine amidotransferase [Halomarina sp. BCD28]